MKNYKAFNHMNYAKMVESAMQLFPQKISVTFIHDATGKKIGTYKIGLEKLPSVFNKPTMLEIEGNLWHIIQAEPVKADDFSFTKKLTLHVQEATNLPMSPGKYSVPTLACDFLATTALLNDFIFNILAEDWRQIEFLPFTMMAIIEEEIAVIEAILSEESNALQGYRRQYIREKTHSSNLAITWSDFSEQVLIKEKRNIQFTGNDFGAHGFALCSNNHHYYGTVEDGYINILCLQEFNCVDDELMSLLEKYELVMVDWCNASVITM